MLDRSLRFIVWENFVDPAVLGAWAGALLLLALLACVALSTGRLIAGARHFETALDEFPLALAAGLGVWVAILFLLGTVGLYKLPVIASIAAGVVAWRPMLSRRPIAVLDPIRLLGRAIIEAPVLWAAFALFSLNSLLPPYRWDEMAYHLAYPQQWIAAGRITTDPFMRYPLYTNNWPLLLGVALMLGGSTLAHLLSWLAGVAAAMVVDRLLLRVHVGRPLRAVAVASFLLTPFVQRYLNVAHADMALMYFLVVTTFAIVDLGREPESGMRGAVIAASCGGMFLGMKILNIAFGPLFIALAWIRLRWSRELAVLVVAGAIIGLPWYVRNLVLGGDPAPPLVSRLLHLPNADWSPEDQAAIEEDLRRGLSRSPGELSRIPLSALQSTEGGPLRDWPALGWILLLPFTWLTWRRLRHATVLEPLVVLWYAVAIWLATAYHLRYAIFTPLAIVCAAVLVDMLARRLAPKRWSLVGAALGILLLVGPTLDSLRYAKHAFSLPIPTTADERAAFVLARNPQFGILGPLRGVAPDTARVYSLGYTMLKYYLQPYGWHIVGDDFHRGRYADFIAALRVGRQDVFFQELDVDVVALHRAELARRFGGSIGDAERRLEMSSALRLAYRDSSHVIYRLERTPRPVR